MTEEEYEEIAAAFAIFKAVVPSITLHALNPNVVPNWALPAPPPR